MEIYVIYKHPMDYPDKFVARKFIFDQPTEEVILENTLEKLREKLPFGLTCVERYENDDPVIVETWI